MNLKLMIVYDTLKRIYVIAFHPQIQFSIFTLWHYENAMRYVFGTVEFYIDYLGIHRYLRDSILIRREGTSINSPADFQTYISCNNRVREWMIHETEMVDLKDNDIIGIVPNWNKLLATMNTCVDRKAPGVMSCVWIVTCADS